MTVNAALVVTPVALPVPLVVVSGSVGVMAMVTTVVAVLGIVSVTAVVGVKVGCNGVSGVGVSLGASGVIIHALRSNRASR
jgi:hypothetical protein